MFETNIQIWLRLGNIIALTHKKVFTQSIIPYLMCCKVTYKYVISVIFFQLNWKSNCTRTTIGIIEKTIVKLDQLSILFQKGFYFTLYRYDKNIIWVITNWLAVLHINIPFVLCLSNHNMLLLCEHLLQNCLNRRR